MSPMKSEPGNISASPTTKSPTDVQSSVEDDDSEEKDCEREMTLTVLPPDGGWGWVIVAAGFFGCLIVDGIIFSFGIIFPDILEQFGDGTSKTSWIGSMMAGMYLTIGPVVSALANKYGCRIVTIIGSIIASFGLMISYFANSVDFLIFSYGVLGGIGFGFIYLPCIVMVQFYFDKRRAFATGITVCGSGIGAFIFAPLSRHLITEYGWNGNLLIQSAIVMNVIAIGGLLRPLEPRRSSSLSALPVAETTVTLLKPSDQQEGGGIGFPKSNSSNSFKPYHENELVQGNNDIVSSPSYEQLQKANTGNNNITNKSNEVNKEMQYKYAKPTMIGVPRLTIEETEEEENEENEPVKRSRTISSPNPTFERTPLYLIPHTNDSPRILAKDGTNRRVSMFTTKAQPAIQMIKADWARRKSLPINVNEEIKRPFYRQDIFYSGSLLRIPQYSSQQSLPRYHHSVMSLPTEHPKDVNTTYFKCFLCPKAMGPILSTMVDFSLLQSATFVVLCVSSFLTMLGFFVPFVYLANFATSCGISKSDAAFLFSVIGISNTSGRVFSGWVSDRPNVNALLITNCALTIGGLATAAVPLFVYYELLVSYSLIFGLSIACFASLRSIILVELLGLEKLTNSFGLLLLYQGIASMIGCPLAGFFFDLTNSYDTSFIIAGSLIALSGIMGFPLPRISRWERRRNEAKLKMDKSKI